MKEQFNSVAVATTMTSLQIAEVTGKRHSDVIRSIRSMEPAWEKVSGNSFTKATQEVKQPNGGVRQEPVYSLTKTECLYVATKFNDEARAKLVLRWEKLETENLNVSLVNEKHNILLAKGLEAARYHNEKLQQEIEWRDKRIERMTHKIFIEHKYPRFECEQANMNTLLKGFDECIDLMWDCVNTTKQLSARVAVLEKKLGIYEPISETLLDRKGGAL